MASNNILGSDTLYACDPCKSYSESEKDAVIYCPDCKEYLCTDCKISHEKLSTRQHETLTLGLQRQSVRSVRSPSPPPPPSSSTPSPPSSSPSTPAAAASSSKIKAALTGVVGKLRPATTNSPPALSMQFDASLETDTQPCGLAGILMLEKVIIVLDQCNDAMKVFDRQNYSFKYSVKAENARNVVQGKKDELVLTSGSLKSVFIFTFSNKSAIMKKQFEAELPCWGLCYSKDQNLLYVVCKEISVRSHVAVYTLDGKLTRRIEPLLPGSQALTSLYDIVIHPKDKRFYITDYNKGLIILSPSGKFESLIQPKELESARSISIDRAGQVYFTGLNSHNLFVLPPGGRDARVVLSKGISDPECFAIDGKQLAVGCRRTNLVKIFQFN